MGSLWRDLAAAGGNGEAVPTARYEGAVSPGERFDVAVVGAGITGLSTALQLVDAGMRVVVLEARDVGALASGLNTGKASVLQGAMLQRLRGSHPAGLARAYVEANGIHGPALAGKLGPPGLEHVRIMIGDHDRRAALQQRLGGAQPDATAASGDESLAAGEVVLLEIHGRPLQEQF